jgi:glycosyltransferase involved in cell wall biosynthesis
MGILADATGQWVQAIAQLAGNPAFRRRMGLAGRRRVEAEFHVAAGAARWLELLDELHHRRKTA